MSMGFFFVWEPNPFTTYWPCRFLPLYLKCCIPPVILVYTPPLPCTYNFLEVTMGTSANITAFPWSDTSSGTSSGHLLSETSGQITACTFFCGDTWSFVHYRELILLLYLPLCYKMLTHGLIDKYLLAMGFNGFFCGDTWSFVRNRKWIFYLYLPLCYKMLTHSFMNRYLLIRGLMISFVGTPGLLWATGNGVFCYTYLFVIMLTYGLFAMGLNDFFCWNTWSFVSYRKRIPLLYLPVIKCWHLNSE